jgi:hypothetical protein
MPNCGAEKRLGSSETLRSLKPFYFLFCPFHYIDQIRIIYNADMSLALGKRKRAVTTKSTLPSKKVTVVKPAPPPPAAPEPESDAEDRAAMNEAFRRAFEKRFKAIEEDKPEEVEVEDETDEEDENAWDGLSEEEEDDENEIEVVEHNMSNFSREKADRAALKAFMVTHHLSSLTRTQY